MQIAVPRMLCDGKLSVSRDCLCFVAQNRAELCAVSVAEFSNVSVHWNSKSQIDAKRY